MNEANEDKLNVRMEVMITSLDKGLAALEFNIGFCMFNFGGIRSTYSSLEMTFISLESKAIYRCEGMGVPQHNKFLSKATITTIKAIRNDILGLVGSGHYAQAVQSLKEFLDSDFAYPNFRLKVERYVNHCIDLILAIEANRNFSSLASLTKPKQYELREKFKKHYDELSTILHKIEVSYEELKAKDDKSTKYFVKAVWASLLIVTINALLLDVFAGLAETVYSVVDNSINKLAEIISQYL